MACNSDLLVSLVERDYQYLTLNFRDHNNRVPNFFFNFLLNKSIKD